MPRQSAAARLVPTSFNRGRSSLRPPPTLSEAERTVFNATLRACSLDHFTAADMPLLVAYSQAAVASAEAAANFKQAGVLTDAGAKWHAVWLKETRLLATLARLLRITPASRTPRYAKRHRPEHEPWYITERREREEQEALDRDDGLDG